MSGKKGIQKILELQALQTWLWWMFCRHCGSFWPLCCPIQRPGQTKPSISRPYSKQKLEGFHFEKERAILKYSKFCILFNLECSKIHFFPKNSICTIFNFRAKTFFKYFYLGK